MVMLAFSFILHYFTVITTHSSTKKSTFLTYPLLHLPETLQLYCSNHIFIYMWFYSLLQTPIYTFLYKFIQLCQHSSHIIPSCHHSSFYFQCNHLFILLYKLLNLRITMATSKELLPLYSLLYVPSTFCIFSLYTSFNKPRTFNHHAFQCSFL
jgi:hypothetical protein